MRSAGLSSGIAPTRSARASSRALAMGAAVAELAKNNAHKKADATSRQNLWVKSADIGVRVPCQDWVWARQKSDGEVRFLFE